MNELQARIAAELSDHHFRDADPDIGSLAECQCGEWDERSRSSWAEHAADAIVTVLPELDP